MEGDGDDAWTSDIVLPHLGVKPHENAKPRGSIVSSPGDLRRRKSKSVISINSSSAPPPISTPKNITRFWDKPPRISAVDLMSFSESSSSDTSDAESPSSEPSTSTPKPSSTSASSHHIRRVPPPPQPGDTFSSILDGMLNDGPPQSLMTLVASSKPSLLPQLHLPPPPDDPRAILTSPFRPSFQPSASRSLSSTNSSESSRAADSSSSTISSLSESFLNSLASEAFRLRASSASVAPSPAVPAMSSPASPKLPLALQSQGAISPPKSADEIVHRLKAPSTGAEGTSSKYKIGLASFFYRAHHLPLANKEHFLVQWIIAALQRSEKWALGAGQQQGAKKRKGKEKEKEKEKDNSKSSSATTGEKAEDMETTKEGTDTQIPEFLDAEYWKLLREILADARTAPVAIRFELLRSLASACYCVCEPASDRSSLSSKLTQEAIALIQTENAKTLTDELAAVFQIVTADNRFARFFTPPIDHLAGFVARISEALTFLLRSKNAPAILPTMRLVSQGMKVFLATRKLLETNHRKLFTLTVGKLLEPLLILRHEFVTNGPPATEQTTALPIVKQIDKALLRTLYHPATLSEYTLSFTVNREEEQAETAKVVDQPKGSQEKGQPAAKGKRSGTYKGSVISNYHKQLFDKLRDCVTRIQQEAKDEQWLLSHKAVLEGMPYIYSGFLDVLAQVVRQQADIIRGKKRKRTRKKDDQDEIEHADADMPRQHIDFHFFQELHSVLLPLLNFESCTKIRAHTVVGLSTLHELLATLVRRGVYVQPQDPDRAQLRALGSITIYATKHLHTVERGRKEAPSAKLASDVGGLLFGNLARLTELNHELVESHLLDLWTLMWRMSWHPGLPDNCADFGRTLINQYSKLRQEEELLLGLFQSLFIPPPNHIASLLHSRNFSQELRIVMAKVAVGKMPALWKLFLDEFQMSYHKLLLDYLSNPPQPSPARSKKQRSGSTKSTDTSTGESTTSISSKSELACHALPYFVTIFAAFVDSTVLVNTNAISVLSFVTDTCDAIISPMLHACLNRKIQRKGGPDRHSEIACSMLYLYNSLLHVREQALRFPSARDANNTVSDDAVANPGCLHLLERSELSTLSVQELKSRLGDSTSSNLQLKFALDILALHHFRRLQIFHSLYNLDLQIVDSQLEAKSDEGGSATPVEKEPRLIQSTLTTLEEPMSELLNGLFGNLESALSEPDKVSGLTWDGLMASVQRAYPVALWNLLAENIQYLSTFASSDQIKLFFRFLLRSLNIGQNETFLEQNQKPAQQDDSQEISATVVEPGSITCSSISKGLLCAASFYELRPLRSEAMQTILEELSSYWTQLVDSSNDAAGKRLWDVLKLEPGDEIASISKNITSLQGNSTTTTTTPKRAKQKKGASAASGITLKPDSDANRIRNIELMRNALEIAMAFPSEYFPLQPDRLRCCLAVLVMSSGLHAIVQSKVDRKVRRSLLSLYVSFRRLLATFAPAPHEQDADRTQWRQCLSNANLVWLLDSASEFYPKCLDFSRKEKNYAQAIIRHTLFVNWQHCRWSLACQSVGNEFTELSKNMLQPLFKDASARLDRGSTSPGELASQLFMPINRMSSCLRAFVEDLAERELQCANKAKFRDAVLIEGEKAQLDYFMIPDQVLQFARHLETMLAKSLDRLAGSPSFAIQTVFTTKPANAASSSGTPDSIIASNHYAAFLSLFRDLLRLRTLHQSRYCRDQSETDMQGESQQQQHQQQSSASLLLLKMGSAVAFATRVLIESIRVPANFDNSYETHRLKLEAASFVEFVCGHLRYFKPHVSDKTFNRLAALVHQLLRSYSINDVTQRNQEIRQPVERAFRGLVVSATKAQAKQMLVSLLEELVTIEDLTRLEVAFECLGFIFEHAEEKTMVTKFTDSPVPVLLHVDSTVQRITFRIMPSRSDDKILAPTQRAIDTATRIYALAFDVLAKIVGCKGFHLNTSAVSLALRATSSIQSLLQSWHDVKKRGFDPSLATTAATIDPHPLQEFIPEPVFLAIYQMLYRCIKHCSKQTIFAIPLFIEDVRQLLVSVVKSQHFNPQAQPTTAIEPLLSIRCAENVSRLMEELSKHPKTLNKYMPYLISDYIVLTDEHPVPPHVRQALLPGIYALLGMCSEHELRLAHTVLDETGKASFKKLYEDFQKNWRFTGKV